jgi:hypothetical protein
MTNNFYNFYYTNKMQAMVAIKDLKFNVLNTSDKIKLILIIGSSTVVSYLIYFKLKK